MIVKNTITNHLPAKIPIFMISWPDYVVINKIYVVAINIDTVEGTYRLLKITLTPARCVKFSTIIFIMTKLLPNVPATVVMNIQDIQ